MRFLQQYPGPVTRIFFGTPRSAVIEMEQQAECIRNQGVVLSALEIDNSPHPTTGVLSQTLVSRRMVRMARMSDKQSSFSSIHYSTHH